MEGSEDRARGTAIVFIRNDKTYFCMPEEAASLKWAILKRDPIGTRDRSKHARTPPSPPRLSPNHQSTTSSDPAYQPARGKFVSPRRTHRTHNPKASLRQRNGGPHKADVPCTASQPVRN